MDSVGLHLVEWPFYPLYVFSYILIRPVCQQEKLYRGDFFNSTTVTICNGVKFREVKIDLSNLFNDLQKERGELTPLSHFQPFHGKLCHINPAQYNYPIPVW